MRSNFPGGTAMPRVIARNAAAGDILADCATTLRRGRERGGEQSTRSLSELREYLATL